MFQKYSQCHNYAADNGQHKLQPVSIDLKRLNNRQGQVGEITENKNHRKLQQIDQFIIFPQKQDLNDDKDNIHHHSERTHGEREDLTQNIRQTGGRGYTDARL